MRGCLSWGLDSPTEILCQYRLRAIILFNSPWAIVAKARACALDSWILQRHAEILMSPRAGAAGRDGTPRRKPRADNGRLLRVHERPRKAGALTPSRSGSSTMPALKSRRGSWATPRRPSPLRRRRLKRAVLAMKSPLACVRSRQAAKPSLPSLLTIAPLKCLCTLSPMAARIGPCAAVRAASNGAEATCFFERVL